MSDLWAVKESKKAGGYFIALMYTKDGTESSFVRKNGDVFYRKLSDAQRACEVRNDYIMEKQAKWRNNV